MNLGELSNEDYSIVPGTDHEELQQLKVIVARLARRVFLIEMDQKYSACSCDNQWSPEFMENIVSRMSDRISTLQSELEKLKRKEGFWSRILG